MKALKRRYGYSDMRMPDRAYGLTLAEWMNRAGRANTLSEHARSKYDLRGAWRRGENPVRYLRSKGV